MQGHRRTIVPLPGPIGFGPGSSSSDAVGDPQICWSNVRSSSDLSGYLLSSSESNTAYINPISQGGQELGRWILGEPSSSSGQYQVSYNEQKAEDRWSSPLNDQSVVGQIQECLQESGNSVSLNIVGSNLSDNNNVGSNLSDNQMMNRTALMQGSSSGLVSGDINLSSGLLGHGIDDCQPMECSDACRSEDLDNLRIPSISSLSNPFGVSSVSSGHMEKIDARTGCPVESRRLSCKRKALDRQVGQSSGSGSSYYVPPAEVSVWHALPSQENVGTGLSISTLPENPLGASPLGQVNPRLGVGVGVVAAFERSPISGGSVSAESSRRNSRSRVAAERSHSSGHFNIPSAMQSSRNLQLDNFLDFMSAPQADDVNPQQQSDIHLPSFRPNLQSSRLSVDSSSRSGSSPSFVLSRERDVTSSDDSNLRRIPRSISEHPMFAPAVEIRNSFQNPVNRSLTGGNISFAGNVASASRSGSRSSLLAPSASNRVRHQSPPRYPRRLSEIVRRSLSSAGGSELGGHNSHHSSFHPSQVSAHDMALASGGHSQGSHASHSRSAAFLERQRGHGFAIPYPVRTLATAGEGRSRLVSEIRHVLDLMRRGEGLRLEDVMILDQSVFFGMADYDRHRDMRLDVDNMSYEELLALEERIGNVCTGLSEETILSGLKRQKYLKITTEDQQGAEPCCVCQEEYNEGDDLGRLHCGHDFHTDCIKQWLMRKNLCPICKMTGLLT